MGGINMFSASEQAAFDAADAVTKQLDNLGLQGGKDNKTAEWFGFQYNGGDVPLRTLTESFTAAQQIKAALGVLGIVNDADAVTVDLNKPWENSGWSVSAPLQKINREKLDKLSPPKAKGISV